jgi:hypothetical protein
MERITQTKKSITLADGLEYEIKPLTLKESKEIIPLLKEFNDVGKTLDDQLIMKVAELCQRILQKSVPNITVERVMELVDLETVQKIILVASGREV